MAGLEEERVEDLAAGSAVATVAVRAVGSAEDLAAGSAAVTEVGSAEDLGAGSGVETAADLAVS